MTSLLLIVFNVAGGVLGAAKEEPRLPKRSSHVAASAARARARTNAGSGEYWATGGVPTRHLGGVQGTRPPRLLDEVVNATEDETTTAAPIVDRLFGKVVLFIAMGLFFSLITALSIADCEMARRRNKSAMEEVGSEVAATVDEGSSEASSAAMPAVGEGIAKTNMRPR